jgi:hypothetical protein
MGKILPQSGREIHTREVPKVETTKAAEVSRESGSNGTSEPKTVVSHPLPVVARAHRGHRAINRRHTPVK